MRQQRVWACPYLPTYLPTYIRVCLCVSVCVYAPRRKKMHSSTLLTPRGRIRYVYSRIAQRNPDRSELAGLVWAGLGWRIHMVSPVARTKQVVWCGVDTHTKTHPHHPRNPVTGSGVSSPTRMVPIPCWETKLAPVSFAMSVTFVGESMTFRRTPPPSEPPLVRSSLPIRGLLAECEW